MNGQTCYRKTASVKRKGGDIVVYYQCNRGGKYKPKRKGKRRLKTGG